MTTAAQMQANRKNAQQSTGPRSAAGKARSRANATRHGLFSRDLASIMPEEDADGRASRRERIWLLWRPESGAEIDLVNRLADIRDELARSSLFEEAYLAGEAQRAARDAAVRREGEADEDGRMLLDRTSDRLPPMGALRRLEATAEGCRWLLVHLGSFFQRLDDPSGCDESERTTLGRLLGWTVDETGGDPRIRRAIQAWVAGTAEDRAFLRSVVADESARLEELLAAREDEHRREAAWAAARTACDVGAGLDRFRRYRAGLRREENKTIELLLKVQKSSHSVAHRSEATRGIDAGGDVTSRVEEKSEGLSAASAPCRYRAAVADDPHSTGRHPSPAVEHQSMPDSTSHSPASTLLSSEPDDLPSALGTDVFVPRAISDLVGLVTDEREAEHRPSAPETSPVARRERRPDPSRLARAFRQNQARLARSA